MYRRMVGGLGIEVGVEQQVLLDELKKNFNSINEASLIVDLLTRAKEKDRINEAFDALKTANDLCKSENPKDRFSKLQSVCEQAIQSWV